MAVFASEAEVRAKFQLEDTTLIPESLVTSSIADAHEILLRFLDPQFDVPSPAAAVILGETLLSGAQLLRSIASSEAFAQKRITLGGQRIEASRRYEVLTSEASDADVRAWRILEPFLLARVSSKAVDVTKTTPLVEEG